MFNLIISSSYRLNNEHVQGVGSMSSGGVSFSCLLELCKVLTIAEDDYENQRGLCETDLIELLQNFLNFKNFTPSDTDLIAFTSKFQNFQNPPGD